MFKGKPDLWLSLFQDCSMDSEFWFLSRVQLDLQCGNSRGKAEGEEC